MRIITKVIHAFSFDGKGGNHAGVVLDADHLSTSQKQAIARKLGFPETAFVSRSQIADFKLDFFTPVKQIAHCGHATIATFTYLKQNGFIAGDYSSKETIDGVRQIIFTDKLAFMEQAAPVFEPVNQVNQLAVMEALGITRSELINGHTSMVVNTGNRFLMVPLKSDSILAQLRPDLEKIATLSERLSLIGFYPFAANSSDSMPQATTRMFAPYYGINEEAGTGMAAGPLACYLYHFTEQKYLHYQLEQGRFMATPSRSLLKVNLVVNKGTIEKLFVGGDAYVANEFAIEIEGRRALSS